MASDILTFHDIQQKLQTGNLILDQSVLGDKGFAILSGLFELKAFSSFITDHQSLPNQENRINFIGSLTFLANPLMPVPVRFCLFDLGLQRHAILMIETSADTYLKDTQVQANRSAKSMIGLYLKGEITYRQPVMIFSSLDYADGFSTFYPADFGTIIPASQIKAGLNFPLEQMEFDDGFIGYIEKLFAGTFESDQEWGHICQMKLENDMLAESQKSAYPKYFFISQQFKSDSLKLNTDTWGIKLERFALGFALAGINELWPQTLIYGSVQIGRQTLAFTADYNMYHGTLALTFHDFPSLKTLLSAFCDPDRYFPGPLASLLDVYLSRFEIIIDLYSQDNRVVEINLSLKTEHEIVLVEHLVELQPTLSLRIQYPFDSNLRQLEGTLSGIWQLGDTKFITSLSYPSYNLYAALAEKQTLDVSALAEKVFGISLPEVEINQMELNGNFITKSFSFELGIISNWELALGGDNKLKFKRLKLGMSYAQQQGPGGLQWQRQYRIISFLELAGVDVYVSAEYIGPGWQFEGSLGRDQSVQLDKLIGHFGFKETDLPVSIQKTPSINYLDITFNTASQDFTFAGNVKFQLDGKELDLALTIEIKRQQDGLYTKHFSGKLKVNKLVFDVIFDDRTGATTFIAVYSDSTSQEQISTKELISALYPSESAASLLPDLTITIKDAVLAYQNQSNATPQSKYLFGLDIDGGLNLSDLQLDDLSLVSAQFPPDQTIKLSFQLLVPSSPFFVTDINALNALLPPGPNHLPLPAPVAGRDDKTTEAIGATHLNVTLRIGGQASQLPLKIDTPIEGNNQLALPSIPSQSNPALLQTNDGTQWVSVQRAFGPLYVEKIGVNYKDNEITAVLNASLTAGGLTIALQGLKATSPLNKLKPTFGLDGLGIEYRSDVFEIAGAFLKMTNPDPKDSKKNITQFAGLATLRTQALSLSAIGAFSKAENGDISLFLYAVLDYPLGGPPFFFVTGLAAGFGYNRALIAPTIEQVASFPLVTQAMGNPTPLPANLTEQQTRLTSELASLSRFVPINVGQTFLAVGIKFTSFKMIESFALLIVQFGNRTEIDLLGLSTLIVPTPKEGESLPALAEAQLALKATFIPTDGFLGLEAQLTSASYIFSRDCHVTGGFAFYSWLNGPHAGDFVVTLGGYHSHFRPPAHYPQRVPRLGINWRINENLSITGQAYYALTAHALMAGGTLLADYRTDWVHAWFKAGADFLLTWQPYHYEASMYVSLGAEVILGTIHISFDAGANLTLWGPPFGGHADIHLWICGFKIFFDIDFGSGHAGAKPISWIDFKHAFLPEDNQVCSISVQSGLLRQITEADKSERWIVNPQSFSLITNSVIPAQDAKLKSENKSLNDKDGKSITSLSSFAIQPMGVKNDEMISTHFISMTQNGKDLTYDWLQDHFIFKPVSKKVPAGMWGAPIIDKDGFLAKPDVNAEGFIEEALCGLVISPKPPKPSDHTHSINRSKFQYDTTTGKDANFVNLKTQSFAFKDNNLDWKTIQASISKNTERDALLQELGLANTLIDFGQPVDQFAISAPQLVDSI